MEQRIQLLEKELKEAQSTYNKELMRHIQDQASDSKKVPVSAYLSQISTLESQTSKLQGELDTIKLKHEREKQEIISLSKKTEYSLLESNARKDIEIQRLQLEKEKLRMEKEREFDQFKATMEKQVRDIKDMYIKEKKQMKDRMAQAEVQAKAFQMLSHNETMMSPVSVDTLYTLEAC